MALAVVTVLGPAAHAADQSEARLPPPSAITSVIELFTSQGCSSCPKADVLLKTYAARPGVLALSLPVDYWDYLGWKDTFGSAKFSERQRAYAKFRGDGQIYTPQAVINGMSHVNGGSQKDIDAAIAASQAILSPNRVPIYFSMDGGNIIIETGTAPAGATVKEATVRLAWIQKSAEVAVGKGENEGKTLTYTNIVRDLTPVGTWTGQPLRIILARTALMRKELELVAVLLQQGKAGPIIAAAVTGLW
ncbi:MAG: DUF1223 domain-containing protein [Gammaproteobacteria bacterium]